MCTKREGAIYSVPTRRARDRAHFSTVHTKRKVPCTLFLQGAHATGRIFPLGTPDGRCHVLRSYKARTRQGAFSHCMCTPNGKVPCTLFLQGAHATRRTFPLCTSNRKVPCTLLLQGAHATRRILPLCTPNGRCHVLDLFLQGAHATRRTFPLCTPNGRCHVLCSYKARTRQGACFHCTCALSVLTLTRAFPLHVHQKGKCHALC